VDSLYRMGWKKRNKIIGFINEQAERRFLGLGIYPGNLLEVVRSTPTKNAYYVKINNGTFALRKEELECIILQAES